MENIYQNNKDNDKDKAADRFAALICPVCGESLEETEHSYICGGGRGKRHCFDRGASGYVNLAFVKGHRAVSGDPPEAVRSRTEFLERGYYLPAADMIAELADEYCPRGLFVDAGCGEGYYSVRLANKERSVFGADLSKYAADRASKRAAAAGVREYCRFAVASVYELPLADGSADAVLSMFSPCAAEENSRVLKPGGVLIVGCAGERHLFELKAAVYDTPTVNEERADLPSADAGLEPVTIKHLSYTMSFGEDSGDDVRRLFGMTPYKYRTSAADMERLAAIRRLDCTADFEFRVYRKKEI